MTHETFQAGKDAPFEQTIKKALSLLEDSGLSVRTSNYINPAPNCWSVHLQEENCPVLYTNGKGTSRQAALAGALGEFFERLATNFFFADYYLEDSISSSGSIGSLQTAPFFYYPDEACFPLSDTNQLPIFNKQGIELLAPGLLDYYNKSKTLTAGHLFDNNFSQNPPIIRALPFYELLKPSKGAYFFPVSLLNNLYVSNGMAAGNSRSEANAQALSEIIERFVKNQVISQGISLPSIPHNRLKGSPLIHNILQSISDHGFAVTVKDASLGGQFPVICALLINRTSGGCFAAFGANCRFEIAVLRTLTELFQGRTLSGFDQTAPPSHDQDLVADQYNLESHFIDSDGLLSWRMFRDQADFPYTFWDFKGSTGEEEQKLLSILSTSGYRPYRAEYCQYGFYTCRILVPGMSEIYPCDDLIWNNKNSTATIRSKLLNLGQMDTAELTDFLDLFEEEQLPDTSLIADLIGVLFPEQSAWAQLRVGELKAMLHLALHRNQESLYWCNWCLDFSNLPPQRERIYRLLTTLLGFIDSEDKHHAYKKNISMFFSDNEQSLAESILDGSTRFHGLNFGVDWAATSAEHRNLLKIYSRLQAYNAKHFTNPSA